MFEGIRRELRELRDSDPGTRFQGGHERHRSSNHLVRLVLICLGLGLVLGGALTFWLPGPQFVIVFVGIAIVAAQWKAVASRLDRLEVFARRWHDEHWEPYPHKRVALVAIWTVVIAVVVIAAWTAWRMEWLPGWLPFLD